MYLSLMSSIKLYNKFLEKKVFTVENPLYLDDIVDSVTNVKATFKIVGTKKYIVLGDNKDHLLYEITIYASGFAHKIISWMMGENSVIYPTTFSSELRGLIQRCNIILEKFLSYFGNDLPLMCVKVTNSSESNLTENLIVESDHDKLVLNIVDDINEELSNFVRSNRKEYQVDLPNDGDYYQTPDFYGEVIDFYVELYLFKTKSNSYKIDADAPGSIDDDYVRVAIYFNPDNFESQQSEIKYNLLYTLRHEYEHLLQVMTDYENIEYKSDRKYRKDSLSTLMKRKEIEPQVRGYYLQSKKEKVPYDTIIKNHLNKLEKNKQIKFLSPLRKDILIKTLIDHAKKLNLPIKLSNQK